MTEIFGNPITVRQLKDFLDRVPDTREDGTPTQVWVGMKDDFSGATHVQPADHDGQACDVLIKSQ